MWAWVYIVYTCRAVYMCRVVNSARVEYSCTLLFILFTIICIHVHDNVCR